MTTITNPKFTQQSVEGEAYSLSNRFTGVANGDSFEMFISVPGGVPTLVLGAATIYASGEAHFDLLENVTVDSSGTSVTPHNIRVGSSNLSSITAEVNGSYSGGEAVAQTLIPGGRTGTGTGSTALFPARVVPPGNNVLLSGTNESGQSNTFAIAVNFAEQKV